MVNLKAERVNRGLTTAEVAEKVGVSRQAILNAENRQTVPRPETAKAIADLYGCKVTDIWPVGERAAA